MGSTRLVSVLGLSFGDCGKGLFTDYLCRQLDAHTVVRFNGGAQAGHNVVLPDGRHHTFSQFGAGSFVPGTVTLLAHPVIVHPTALLVENDYLRRAGVPDALDRLLIDGRCRVTTPYHQAANRLRELARGVHAHGSCGVGVGETVRHALADPRHALTYSDLFDRPLALDKLEAIRAGLRAAFDEALSQPAYDAELALLDDPTVSRRWLDQAAALARRVPAAPREMVAERLHRPGTVVFEGAQGVLLDEWRGFHPHTTWSSICTAAVEAVARDAGQDAKVQHFGVLRSYMTRHGQGPLPTHDPRLDRIGEPHNVADGWQGAFRRGHPDAVLLRYALAVAGELDGLFVSHLDVLEREPLLRWCTAYEGGSAKEWDDVRLRDEDGLVAALVPSAGQDLDHQARLTQLLQSVRPRYETEPIANAEAFIEQVERIAKLPVALAGHGPTHRTVRAYG